MILGVFPSYDEVAPELVVEGPTGSRSRSRDRARWQTWSNIVGGDAQQNVGIDVAAGRGHCSEVAVERALLDHMRCRSHDEGDEDEGEQEAGKTRVTRLMR